MTGFALQMNVYLLEMSSPTAFVQLTIHSYILRFIHEQKLEVKNYEDSFFFGLGLFSGLRFSEKSSS